MLNRDYLLMFLNQYISKVNEEHFQTFLRILIFKLTKNVPDTAYNKSEIDFLDFINIVDHKKRTSKTLFLNCSKTLTNKAHREINIPEYPKVVNLCDYIFPTMKVVKFDKDLSFKINSLVADYQYFIWNNTFQEFYFQFLNSLYPNMCPTNKVLLEKDGDKFIFKLDTNKFNICKKERYTILLFSFQIPGLAHENALFIDNVRKTIERFEPYGIEYSFEMYKNSGFNMEDLDDSLKKFLKLSDYKTVYSSCPLQTIDEKFEQQHPLLLKPYGWCTLYSIVFLTFKIYSIDKDEKVFLDKSGDVRMSEKKENKKILDNLLEFIQTNNFSSLNEFMYYYSSFIVALFSIAEKFEDKLIQNLNMKKLAQVFSNVFHIFETNSKVHLMNFLHIPEKEILNDLLKLYQSGGKSKTKIRKHKGINQITGKLNKGYKYSGKKLKNGLGEIVKI